MTPDNNTLKRNGVPVQVPYEPHLPALPETRNVGTRIVQRAMSLVFLLLGVGIVATLLMAFTVSIDLTIDAQGTLEPATLWPVRSQASGMLATLLVIPGDTVQQGQPLARLDSLQLKSTIQQLQATYRIQRLELQRARAAYLVAQRLQTNQKQRVEAQYIRASATLLDQMTLYGLGNRVDSLINNYDAGTHVSLDLTMADVLAAEADRRKAELEVEQLVLTELDLQKQEQELEKLSAQIEEAQHHLSRLTIHAPATGIVLTEQLEQRVGAFLQEGELLLEIAEPQDWTIDLLVAQRDISEIQLGDNVKLEIQALQRREKDLFYGRVSSIASNPVGLGTDTSTEFYDLYRVTVVLPSEELDRLGRNKLRRGYSVNGKIITRSGLIGDLLWRYLQDQFIK